MTQHGRYRHMTFKTIHVFPSTWKAAVLGQRLARSSYSSFAWQRRLRASWREMESKPYRNCGSCARGDVLPTDCLITVVMGGELRQQLIFCVFWPGFAIKSELMMQGQMCERVETFWKIHYVAYGWDCGWHKQKSNNMEYFLALFLIANSFPPWLRQSLWISFTGFCSVVNSINSLWGRNNMSEQKQCVMLSCLCISAFSTTLQFPLQTCSKVYKNTLL